MNWNRMIHTERDWTLTIARVALGTVLLAHGVQKAFGWLGGYGFEGTMGFFQSIGVPAFAALLVIAAETLGALGLIAGLLGRVAAAGAIAVFAGAVALIHLPNGFFMNWGGTQAGEGYEFFILGIALALVVAIRGSGALSADRWLSRQVEAPAAAGSGALSRAA